MTYKNFLVNCVLLNAVFCYSVNTKAMAEELYIGPGDSYTLENRNLTKLVMSDTASLILRNGNNVDEATFSGDISDDYSGVNDKPLVLFSTKTTFRDVDVVGNHSPLSENKTVITWGDQTSFWSNELVITGDVTMDTVQVGMSSDAVKGADFFTGSDDFDLFEPYDAGSSVVWNGGLYETKLENQGKSFQEIFYEDLADKVDSGDLVQLNEMDQYTLNVGIGQSYNKGDVFQVVGTNQFLNSVGLINGYEGEPDSAIRVLAFRVSNAMDTLSPEDASVLTQVQLPISYDSGFTIKDANVTLNRTSIMGHQDIDPIQRVSMGQEFKEIYERVCNLDNLLPADEGFITEKLSSLDLQNGPDEFWNVLRDYYYSETGSNQDIKQAYKDTDAIHTKYLRFTSLVDALPVTIENSVVTAKNSSIQKQDSGAFVIDHSQITLYGAPDPIMPNNVGGSVSLLNHTGATGDFIIRNNSELNLYPCSNLHRAGESGNIYIIGSTVNMRGDNMALIQDDIESMNIDVDDIDGTSISVNNGNIQLTDGSVLNAYGDENYLSLPESEIDMDAENWQEALKAKSFYVNNSVINIAENSSLETGITSGDDEENNDADDKVGTIVMDVNSVINVRGVLGANVVSLHTDTDAGIINVYDNALIDGGIYRANVFVNPGSERKTINMYGRLSLTDSILDIGTNALTFHSIDDFLSDRYGENYQVLFAEAGEELDPSDPELNTAGFLYLDNSTIITHIDLKKNTNGTISVEKLEFGDNPSVVKIVIDDGVLNPQGATFDFLTGDTDIGENLVFSNVMYDITYSNGQLTLVPNGNSGIISLDALNDRLAATGWLSSGFKDGSRAKMIADALNEWAQTDPETFKKAIRQIQPDTAPTKQAHSKSHNNQLANIVESHMGHGNGHSGHNSNGAHRGRSGGDAFKNVSVWAQGLYNKSKLDTSNGFNGNTYGFALGADTEISKNLRLGLGYAYTDSDIDTKSRDTDVDSHTAILYGQYDFGNAFVNGITTYGFNRYEEQSGIKSAKYNMDTIFAQAMTGYNFYIDSLGLTPELGLRYLWTNAHSYTDSAEQDISGNKTNTLAGVLGTSVSTEIQSGNFVLKPLVKALATYDMMKDADKVNVMLANGSSYVVSDSEFNRFGAEFGIGLNMNYKTFDLSLNYDIEVRENYTSQSGMLRAKYNF